MYYFEVKTNLDLDSEKSKATDVKVKDITNWMIERYPECEVSSGILSCWYKKEVGLTVKVKNVIYMEDFFKIIDIDVSEQYYYSLMCDFGSTLDN